jgi:outer membrane protein assembly factor BamD (BamD/ComL family)
MAQREDASETRIMTANEEMARIECALGDVAYYLGRMQPTAATERLKLSLHAFRRIVDSWSTHPPTGAQLALIRDHVAAMLLEARRTVPTVRMRRSA